MTIGDAAADLSSGLIAHYPLDGSANDTSGNGNHGTVFGATSTEDRFGNPDSAYSFDGIDDYIEVQSDRFMGLTGNITLSLWMRTGIVGKVGTNLLNLQSMASTQWYRFRWDGGNLGDPGTFSFSHFANSGGIVAYIRNEPVEDNKWYHIVGVSQDGKTLKIYKDGVLKRSVTGSFKLLDQLSTLIIGNQVEASVDDIRLYDRVLSDEEIQELLNDAIVSVPEKAAKLAKSVVGGNYLWGGKGWDNDILMFVDTATILSGTYTYFNDGVYDADGNEIPDSIRMPGFFDNAGKGLDCSGLVAWSFNSAFDPNQSISNNIVRNWGSDGQYNWNTKSIEENELRAGDLLFFDRDNNGHMDHVAMYVGGSGNDVVEAAFYGVGIIETKKDNRKNDPGFKEFKRIDDPRVSFSVKALSPVDLVVTDPDGFTITPNTVIVTDREVLREVPRHLYYSVIGIDDMGSPKTEVFSPALKTGDYIIHVIPRQEALPTDIYSLIVTAGDTVTIIADNKQIKDIPPEPFVVNIQGVCEIRTDYDQANCDNRSLQISSLADYLTYVDNDFGRGGGSKYKSLHITGNLSSDVLDIESPCYIRVEKNISLTGKFVSLDGRKGVFGKSGVRINAENSCVLSESGSASLGNQAQVDAETMTVLASETAMIGQRSTLTIGGVLTLTSTGDLPSSHAIIGKRSSVKAGSVRLSASRSAVVEKLATVHADDVVALRSTGDTQGSNARLANRTKVFAQSLNFLSPLLTSIGKKARVDVRGDLTMNATGERQHSHALISNRADVRVGGAMALTSGAKTTLGKRSKVEVGGNFQMEAGSAAQCTVSGNVSVSFVSKSGNCAPLLP